MKELEKLRRQNSLEVEEFELTRGTKGRLIDTFARNDEIVRTLKEQTERDRRRIEELEKRISES